MRYQKVEELSSETLLLLKTATGETIGADRVKVKANLKEAFRLELHNEIRKLAADETAVQAPGLIKYQGLEKVDQVFCLVRKDNKDHRGTEPYRPTDLAGVIPVLRRLVQIMDLYHRQGLVLMGLSPGLLQLDSAGEVLLQDPPVMNHLAQLLEGDYEYSLPTEVIKGQTWGVKADVFSWGELAYRLLTGEAPFAAAQPEDRVAKVIAGMVIDPRNIQPQLGKELSLLILACLAVEPQRRPTVTELLRQLDTLINHKKCLASPEEVVSFKEKAAFCRSRQQTRERFRLWWRKQKLTLGVIAGIVVFLSVTFFWPRPHTITSKTTPDAVINYYFRAIQTVNAPLLGETIYKTKNDLSGVISNIHVLNTTRKANEMRPGVEDAIKVELEGPRLKKEQATATVVIYHAKYQIKYVTAQETQYLSREDRFKLTPVRRVWRITRIDKLKERHWSEKRQAKQPQLAPGPTDSLR